MTMGIFFLPGERGYGYKNSVFHRIVPGYIVQGGDFTSRDGNGQMSIYGGLFEDENFLVPHDSPGTCSGPSSHFSAGFVKNCPWFLKNVQITLFFLLCSKFEPCLSTNLETVPQGLNIRRII